MNILQVQDALKNASDQQLAGELQNPTGMAPSYLVLSELKRRQQMRQGSQAAQAPQGSMAEEAAGAAEPEYYPEEQQQEEAPGIEAFREGGVVRMADGGLSEVPLEVLESEFQRRNLTPPERRSPIELPRWLRGGRREEPPPGTQRWTDPTANLPPGTVMPFGTPRNALPATTATREDLEAEISRRRAGSVGSSMEAETAPLRNYRPPAPTATESTPPAASEPYGPPAPPAGQSQAPSPTRAGAGIGAVANQPAQPAQQEEGISSLYGRLRELSPSREEYRKDAVNNALMQAGLAMMASKDPNAMANLGAGGLRGLQAYTEEMKTGRAQQRQAIADEITARRANTEELYRRGLITNQERMIRLQEMRLGQAAGERSEARSEAAANRRLQIEANEAANMRSMLPTIRSRIADINKDLTSPMASLSTEEKAALRTELEGLLNNERQIRAWLMTRQGLSGNTPAQTEGSGRPPPGQIRQPNLW